MLTHRVWLLSGVPEAGTLTALRAAGVDGLVVPVGRVEVGDGSSRFTLAPLPDLRALAGWPLTVLVWVEGADKASGDAAGVRVAVRAGRSAASPGRRGCCSRRGGSSPVSPASQPGSRPASSRRWSWRRRRRTSPRTSRRGDGRTSARWRSPSATPGALGFPASTLQDDLAALDRLDAITTPYRAAIVVAPARPTDPGARRRFARDAGGAGRRPCTRPGERGDTFRLRKPVDWGGVEVEAGRTITVEAVDTARYHRDLGLLLRPVRPALEGWDTVGLPAPEPALGMSREAFLEYLQGGSPVPAAAGGRGVGRARGDAGRAGKPHRPGQRARDDRQLGRSCGSPAPRCATRSSGSSPGWSTGRSAPTGSGAGRRRAAPPRSGSTSRSSRREARVTGALVTFISRPARGGEPLGDAGRRRRHRDGAAGRGGAHEAVREPTRSTTASAPPTRSPSAHSHALTDRPRTRRSPQTIPPCSTAPATLVASLRRGRRIPGAERISARTRSRAGLLGAGGRHRRQVAVEDAGVDDGRVASRRGKISASWASRSLERSAGAGDEVERQHAGEVDGLALGVPGQARRSLGRQLVERVGAEARRRAQHGEVGRLGRERGEGREQPRGSGQGRVGKVVPRRRRPHRRRDVDDARAPRPPRSQAACSPRAPRAGGRAARRAGAPPPPRPRAGW